MLHSVLLMGMLLLVARRWRVPFGSFTAVLTLNAVLMSFQTDKFQFIPAAMLAGVAAALLLRRAAPFESALRLRLVGAGVCSHHLEEMPTQADRCLSGSRGAVPSQVMGACIL